MVRCLFSIFRVFGHVGQTLSQSVCCYDAYKLQDCLYTVTSCAFPVLGSVQYTRNRSLHRYNGSKSETRRLKAISLIARPTISTFRFWCVCHGTASSVECTQSVLYVEL